TEDGKKIIFNEARKGESGEEGLSNLGGGLVISQEGKISVVPLSEINTIDKNQKGVVTYKLCINSSDATQKLDRIDENDAEYQGTYTKTYIYPAIYLTINKSEGSAITYVLSAYNPNHDGICDPPPNIRQWVGICSQIQQEQNGDSFNMLIPDANWAHGYMNDGDKVIGRDYGVFNHGTLNVPFILAAVPPSPKT
ncbi:hypothetical protein HGB07_09300, partial [Candidatus Roizmanbacteria bacterium]|nr:hypothetical protein [Candidatus Roizmanbacteria bacterium]